jgi:uncharacterized membrane protein YhaH (DUF805 family)
MPDSAYMKLFLIAIPEAAIGISLMIPTYAIMVRRLHDIGWSGWWLLLAIILIAALLVLALLSSSTGLLEMIFILAVIWGLFLIVLFCRKTKKYSLEGASK